MSKTLKNFYICKKNLHQNLKNVRKFNIPVLYWMRALEHFKYSDLFLKNNEQIFTNLLKNLKDLI